MPFTIAEWLVLVTAIGTVLTNLVVTWTTSGRVSQVAEAVPTAVSKIDALQQEVQLLRHALADKTRVAAGLAAVVARSERTRSTDAKGAAEGT